MAIEVRILGNGDKSYFATYRGPDRREHSKAHKTKARADDWLADKKGDIRAGTWIDPARAKKPLADLWPAFRAEKKQLKPTGLKHYVSLWDSRIEPRFGQTPVGMITKDAIQTWVNEMSDEHLSSARIRHALGALGQILDSAVEKKMITTNPSVKVKRPRAKRYVPRALTAEQVAALCRAIPLWRDYILFLAGTGLRMAEFSGLRVRDADLTRGSENIRIARTLNERSGEMYEGEPKTWHHRTVALPAHLVPLVRMRTVGRDPDEPLFLGPEEVGPIRGSSLRTAMKRVTDPVTDDETGEVLAPLLFPDFGRVTPKDLRSTAASLAIQANATVVTVSKMLGHRDAFVTLVRYAAFFPDDQEALRGALNKVWGNIVL